MKNRVILIFVLALTLTALFAVYVGAASPEEDFEYFVSDNGAVITKYVGTDKDVTVPSTIGGYPVYSIDSYAFYYNHTIETLTLSEGICRMESEAVFGCSSLRSVHFPSTLELVPFPDAFLRTGVTTIPKNCDALETVTVAEGNNNIVVYDGALYTKDMKFLLMLPPADPRQTFYVPEGVTDITSHACANNLNLREVVLPSSLNSMQYWCFIHDVNLEKINIPENCTYIGQYTFQNTSIKSLHIPASLTNIMQGAFGSNCLLETITVDPANTVYYAIDNVLYASRVNGIAVAKYPAGSEATEFTIPDGVSNIDWYAFDSASNLKNVIFPDSLKLIGYSAFSYCDNLLDVTLPEGLKDIEGSAFFNCYKFRSIVIPASVTYLGNSVFGNVPLEEIIFMGDAPDFESSAFSSAGNTIAYYPEGNDTWTPDVLQDYGGTVDDGSVTWKSYTIKNGWVKEGGNWYYYVDNVKQKGWLKLNDHWYYMDKSGVMQTGWEKINGYWYYMSKGGVMQTGLTKINGKYYCFGNGGAMLTGWQHVNGKLHWFDDTGAAVTGWIKVGESWYYLKETGEKSIGWVYVGGYWYYMDEYGLMKTGLFYDGKAYYYTSKGGAMQTGWVTINGTRFHFNANGTATNGWLKDGNKWYYIRPHGAIATGWVKDGDYYFFLDKNGVMQTGWVKDENYGDCWFYLNKSGVMQTGWIKDGDYWFYLNKSGVMQTGTQVIGGKTYVFNKSGVWIG